MKNKYITQEDPEDAVTPSRGGRVDGKRKWLLEKIEFHQKWIDWEMTRFNPGISTSPLLNQMRHTSYCYHMDKYRKYKRQLEEFDERHGK
jgi:hypothetical protein